MAFKMKSGNKVSFKNMGSSPVKQGLGETKSTILPSGSRIEGLEIKKEDEGKKGLVAQEEKIGKKWVQGREGEEGEHVDINAKKEDNKESKMNNGDKKSKWDFDFMQLLDSFLTSGGGKKGLLKAAGAALRSPNERLEAQKKRELKKVKVQNIEKEGLGD